MRWGVYGTSRQRCVHTPQEIFYTENGGLLQYVLRQLAANGRSNPAGVTPLTEPIRNWTGAPGSSTCPGVPWERTWAENGFFQCFCSMHQDASLSNHPLRPTWQRALKGLRPVVFGPCTLVRTWAPVQFLMSCRCSLKAVKVWSRWDSLAKRSSTVFGRHNLARISGYCTRVGEREGGQPISDPIHNHRNHARALHGCSCDRTTNRTSRDQHLAFQKRPML